MARPLFLTVISIFLCLQLIAQHGLYQLTEKHDEDPFDELSYFMVGGNYLSNNVYLGRKDSSILPYFGPYFGYHMANGLYAKASVAYAPIHKFGHFDMLDLELGYDRTFGQHLLVGANLDKYVYHKNSPGIRSQIKSSMEVYAQWQNEVLEPKLIFDINKNKNNDYLVSPQIDHKFYFNKDRLIIEPALTYNVGSQHFYEDYFIARFLKRGQHVAADQALKDAGSIKPLDVELSAKTTLRAGKWLFTFAPTYAIPQSPATIQLPNRIVQEQLSPTFFVELDACLRLERK